MGDGRRWRRLSLVVGAAALATTCARTTVELAEHGETTGAAPTDAPATDAPTTAAAEAEPPTTAVSPPDSPTTAAPTTAAPSSATTAQPASVVPTSIRLDRRVADDATEGFDALVESVLTDGRGWSRAGFEFVVGSSDAGGDADYTVVLAEGSEVDQLCLPYDTGGRFSCQIGPVVALNADRWRTAVESWPGSLDEYRTMLVNHEVGHLIGQHHPAERCPGEGQPAPVMAQQSSGVAPCTANPWPLDWEIECASLGLEPLAPPYERDIQLTCGPDGPLG